MNKKIIKTRQITQVIFKNAQILDITGPMEVFAQANEILTQSFQCIEAAYEISLVSHKKGPVAMSSGLKLVADESFDSFSIAPQSLDTLLIAGGNGVYQAGFQKDFLDFIKTQGGQSQFSTSLAQQFAVKGILKETLTWMNQNPDKAMSIDSLAHRCAMSERNFARIFKQEVGMTPGKYVEKMRVEYAVRQIETHDQGFKLIAHISGFDSEERMRRAFKRQLNVLPHLYRKRFGR